MEALVAAIVGLVGGLAWLFRLEAKNQRNGELIAVLFKTIEKNEIKIEHSLDENRKTLLSLTMEVTKMMERLDHTNKKVIDLNARELRQFLKE